MHNGENHDPYHVDEIPVPAKQFDTALVLLQLRAAQAEQEDQ